MRLLRGLSAYWPARRGAQRPRQRALRAHAAAAAPAPAAGCFSAHPSPSRGLLPVRDPPRRLASSDYAPWEEVLDELPQLLLNGRVRAAVSALPRLDPAPLLAAADPAQLWRAQLLLSFLAHAYVHGDGAPPTSLPAQLAVPWVAVSDALDAPPVLTYATYNLLNWRRLDADGPLALGNLACLHNFGGGQDEQWFRVVHVAIEAAAGAALCALPAAQAAAGAGDAAGVRAGLASITGALREMQAILARMPERCDPYVYYHRVRWPMAGWRGNPALPAGLFYEGVGDSAPRQLYGETGAQSAVVPALDAALGISHAADDTFLSDYLAAMRRHMPREQRAFLAACEAAPPLRAAAQAAGPGALRDAYDEAVAGLSAFRTQHRNFAAAFIAKHSPRAEQEKGTGGSDFMPALAGYQRHTARAKLGDGGDAAA
jgi:indoleamine 2,3-dioxygenase